MKMYSSIKYHETYVEFWGASTKHPDSRHCFQSDIENKRFTPMMDGTVRVCDFLSYLLYIASTKTWIHHAMETAEDTLELYKIAKKAGICYDELYIKAEQ